MFATLIIAFLIISVLIIGFPVYASIISVPVYIAREIFSLFRGR